jgi:CheY-like chemotaxis protein
MDSTGILAVVEQDARLIWQLQELCADYGLRLNIARSAEEAILYLRGVGIYARRAQYPLPRLMLLDTQNSNAGDLQILGWLREDPRFSEVPVGLLVSEAPHKVRVACAIDPHCFMIDRQSLWELGALAWHLFFQASGCDQGPPSRAQGTRAV